MKMKQFPDDAKGFHPIQRGEKTEVKQASIPPTPLLLGSRIVVTSGAIAFLMLLMVSCGGGIRGDQAETGEAQSELLIKGDKTLVTDPDQSVIEWVGSKPTGKHNGTLSLQEGTLELSDGNLIGGEFVMDMSSIKVLDLTDKKQNNDLRGHLMSADFFSVDSFPTATFVITGIEEKKAEGVSHRITGNLTIKGIAKSVSFDALVKIDDQQLVATTPQFVINRANWNVRYGSKSFFNNLQDNFIDDAIGLKINLKAAIPE